MELADTTETRSLQSKRWLTSLGPPTQVKPNNQFSCTDVCGAGNKVLRLFTQDPKVTPDTYSDGRYAVIVDGVLYNQIELGKKLAISGNASCGAATLLADAYRLWGPNLLRHTKGIFALIVWDSLEDTLLCARDPLGVYPLFYAQPSAELLLSMSTEVLARHPAVSNTPNQLAVADHLCSRWPDLGETFYRDIRRIGPGHMLWQQDGVKVVRRYWDPLPPGCTPDWATRDEVDGFDQVFQQAVARSFASGPAGILLSGGIDSVSVAAMASDLSDQRQQPRPHALSLVFPHPDCNEESTQTGVAKTLGLSQTLVPFDQAVGGNGLVSLALELSSRWSMPLQNVWSPAYQHLCELARHEGCTTILTGGGGDEWLGVTPSYAADLLSTRDFTGLYRFIRHGQRSYNRPSWAIAYNIMWSNGIRPLLGGAARQWLSRLAPSLLAARRRRVFHHTTPRWIATDTRLRQALMARATTHIDESGDESHYLREVRSQLDHPLVAMDMEEYFEWGEVVGLPLRQPYFDADLVDLLFRTPPELLNMTGRSKGLVRRMLSRRLPNLGFERQRKTAATDFFVSLILKEGPSVWKAMRGTPALAELGVVEPTALSAAIDDAFAQRGGRSLFHFWHILTLETWLRPRVLT